MLVSGDRETRKTGKVAFIKFLELYYMCERVSRHLLTL